ncbi:MAG: nucleotidyltransferase domain-containing protein [bacterium]|nr:nucleotidyltransferase domain-containing protein [bacterium]
MGKNKIQKQLKIFIKRVREAYEPEEIILFGSYARGEATEYSDVDILVVARSFKNIDPFKRHIRLHKLGNDLNPDFNAFGFTPIELKKSSYLTTLRDALQTGVVIA